MTEAQARRRMINLIGFPIVTLNALGILLLGLPLVLAFIVPFCMVLLLSPVLDSFDDGAGSRWLRSRRSKRRDDR